ncbi:MAG: hypothetical protein ACLFUH_00935 [Bacteroidales bacterium]
MTILECTLLLFGATIIAPAISIGVIIFWEHVLSWLEVYLKLYTVNYI